MGCLHPRPQPCAGGCEKIFPVRLQYAVGLSYDPLVGEEGVYACGGRARSRGPVRKIVPDSVPGTDPRSGLDRPTFVRGTLRRSRAAGSAPSGDSGARWGCGAGVPQRESQEGSGGAGSAGRPDPGPGQQIQQERAAGDACIGALAPNLAAGSRTEHTAGGGGVGFPALPLLTSEASGDAAGGSLGGPGSQLRSARHLRAASARIGRCAVVGGQRSRRSATGTEAGGYGSIGGYSQYSPPLY